MSSMRLLSRIGAALFVSLSSLAGPCLAQEVLIGPPEELSVLDEFTSPTPTWQSKIGENLTSKIVSGLNMPGVAESVMQIEYAPKQPGLGSGGANQLAFHRKLAPGSISKDAEGIQWTFSFATGGQRWTTFSLSVGDETYSFGHDPQYPSRLLAKFDFPFSKFKSGDKTLTADKIPLIDGVGVEFDARYGNVVYLDRLTSYRHQRSTSWLSVTSSQPSNNIFQPGQPVRFTLTPGGAMAAGAKAFRYEVTDFYEKVTASGTVKLDGASTYSLDLTPKAPGYYELRAWWQDEAGKDLEPYSCIKAEGTLPPGLATFALMPHTVAENIERFKGWGDKAFFGLHGDFLNIADLVGLTWRFGYRNWGDLEPSKPDRSKGMAQWAIDRIANEKPEPEYRVHIRAGSGNYGNVEWAKQEGSNAIVNWDAYLPVIRDEVAVEKHLYPHQKPRIYGVGWEINLFMPPYNFKPVHTVQDVFELHKRVYETIKAADADSVVMGPCSSNLNQDWFEPILKTGLLAYVDAIETHAYPDNLMNPEENDYAGKLTNLRKLMGKYNNGKVVPIYVTEAGVHGIMGSEIMPRKQGQLMARLAIILKAEGVKVFLPFYGIDYDHAGWWGFCFNLDVDGKPSPWHTQRISPKATVNAMATCVDMLEGTTPVRKLEGLGQDVWAYQFDRQGKPVVAIWAGKGKMTLRVPAGDLASVESVDIMGRREQLPAREGQVELTLDGSPQYLVGFVPAAKQ